MTTRRRRKRICWLGASCADQRAPCRHGNWSQVFSPDATRVLPLTPSPATSTTWRAPAKPISPAHVLKYVIKYPVHALEDSDHAIPGQDTPAVARGGTTSRFGRGGSSYRSSPPNFYSVTFRFHRESSPRIVAMTTPSSSRRPECRTTWATTFSTPSAMAPSGLALWLGLHRLDHLR